jgi:hypothetical protein
MRVESMRGTYGFLRAITAPAALVALAPAAAASEIRVPGDHATIQAAIDAAANGDVIVVAAGTYPESIVWESKAVELIGAGPGVTIVDPHAGPGGRCLKLLDVPSPARLSGFTCRGGIADSGGGMHIDGGAPLLENVAFEHNASTGGPGGGLLLRKSTATLSSCTFRDNSAFSGESGDRGGGLYATDSTLVVGETEVRGNRGKSGGGIWVERTSMTVAHCVFEENTGDGLYTIDSQLKVTDTRFARNEGQGMLASWGDVSMERCEARENTSVAGGGVFLRQAEFDMKDSVFADNAAGLTLGESGGTVTGCSFAGNAGNGLESVSGHVRVIASRFERNGGGGIVAGDASVTIRGSTFVQNQNSEDGGAVAIDVLSSADIRDSVFRENRSLLNGGALGLAGASTLINSVFDRNRAGQDGGGLFVSSSPGDGSATVVLHNTFSRNETGHSWGAIAIATEGRATVTNSIFWDNGGSEIGGPGSVSMTYSDVRGGFPGTGNIDADPRFAGAPAGNFHLSPGSPCRDAGINTGSLPATDLDGNPRIQGAAPDMGAYELPALDGDQALP